MGSLTPPWADELLAQNTKIARKMMTSLSTESYFDEDTQLNTKVVEISTSPSPPRQQQQRPNRFLVSLAGHPNNITNDGGRHSPSGSATMTPNNAGVGSVNGEMSGGKVVEPPTGKMASSQSTSSASSSASTVVAANNNNNNSAPSSAGSPRMVHRQYTRNTGKEEISRAFHFNMAYLYFLWILFLFSLSLILLHLIFLSFYILLKRGRKKIPPL